MDRMIWGSDDEPLRTVASDRTGRKGTKADAACDALPPGLLRGERWGIVINGGNKSTCGMFPLCSIALHLRPDMEQREQQIIDQSAKVFMRLGIRSVNMDDIAQHLRISKKTLYQYVKDKNELVLRIVKHITDTHRDCILGICQSGHIAIDESFEITRFVAEQVGQVHPSVHFDLQKYHPEAWDLLQSTERADIYRCISENLRKGMAEGLYRDDLNVDVIARIYISRFDVTFDGELFPTDKYRFEEVIWEMFRYHIRGIASDKGVKYLMKKVQKERNTTSGGPATKR